MPPRDVNLQLASKSQPLTAVGVAPGYPYVETEGGYRADIVCELGVITDSDETINLSIDVSRDDGANWYTVVTFVQFVNAVESHKISRPCYIPKPLISTPTYQAPAKYTRVRARVTAVGGTTPSLPADIFVEPLLSLAVPEYDDIASEGLAYLY